MLWANENARNTDSTMLGYVSMATIRTVKTFSNTKTLGQGNWERGKAWKSISYPLIKEKILLSIWVPVLTVQSRYAPLTAATCVAQNRNNQGTVWSWKGSIYGFLLLHTEKYFSCETLKLAGRSMGMRLKSHAIVILPLIFHRMYSMDGLVWLWLAVWDNLWQGYIWSQTPTSMSPPTPWSPPSSFTRNVQVQCHCWKVWLLPQQYK